MQKSKASASAITRSHLTYRQYVGASSLRVRSCGRTDIGLRRTRNEDYFGIDDREKVYLLADGMGGGPHGDLAARLAVDTIHEALARSASTIEGGERLEWAIQQGRTKICNAIRRDPELIGMGTTVVGLYLEDSQKAVVAHVGDSRAYRLRNHKLELLTRDHTMAAALVDEGHLTETEAVDHRLSHVLTRALCRDGICDVETTETSIREGDIFLLCSDGLSNMLSDAEIQSFLRANGGTQGACDRLIHAALRRGGRDNITVVLVEIVGDGES